MKEAPLSRKIFTITAPTGSGKTLAALASAFILRNKLEKSGIARPRIIYALPFTSIVDQTYGTIREVLSTYQTDKNYSTPPSSWLLKHHHLAENIYHTAGESDMESLSLDKSLLLIESWQSEIIVTTFVQLLHTFVGNENRMLKKFHRLQNSILILDEVQNIPVEYWPLVENVLREACHHLGTRVLLLTATRPEWFGKDEILELGGADLQIRRRFATLDRVTITANLEPFTVEELAVNFQKQYNSDQSYLVILNTIKLDHFSPSAQRKTGPDCSTLLSFHKYYPVKEATVCNNCVNCSSTEANRFLYLPRWLKQAWTLISMKSGATSAGGCGCASGRTP